MVLSLSTNLFNLCITHGCGPVSFSSSVIAPVVKDRNGDASAVIIDLCRQ